MPDRVDTRDKPMPQPGCRDALDGVPDTVSLPSDQGVGIATS